MWATNGLIVNPSAGTILADTGALLKINELTIIVNTDVGFTMNLVQRNAGNTSNIHLQPIPITQQLTIFSIPIDALNNERIRLEVDSSVTANIYASIMST